MKILFSILFLTLFSVFSFAQQAKEKTEPVIVAGKGWGVVSLNAKRKVVEKVLGKGEGRERNKALEDVYFREYPEKGVQVSYRHKDDKVEAIFFYNKQRRYEQFTTPAIKTDKGISWSSSPEEVIQAYGKPKNDFNDDDRGGTWRRIVFNGIDFRFENNVMVRIGLPGD